MPDPHEALQEALAEKYELLEVLGEGGMGTVYRARDLRHDRQVAIKTIRTHLPTTGLRDRFQREIQITAHLQHPNILPLHDSGIAGDTPFYVMPYVEGESLRERLTRDGTLTDREVIQIGRDVASALDYAHQHEVVHRDIKPDNILLTSDRAVVADFGISRALGEDAGTGLTQSGALVGTPAYMPPEQYAGEVTGRSDIYALGAVLYQSLTGRRWLLGTAVNEADWSNVDPEMRSALAPALEPSPEDRWQEAGAFRKALGQAGHGMRDVVHEIHRRRLWQVLGSYAVGSWVVLQLAETLASLLGFPSWFGPAIIVVLALGLPVLLLTAWTQSVRRARASGTAESDGFGRLFTWRNAALGGAVMALLLMVGVAGYTAMRTLGIGPPATLIGQGALGQRTEVVLADFMNETRDSLLGPALGRALRIDLGQSPVVSVIDPERIANALERMEQAPETKLDLPKATELAFREGIGAVLAPAIDQVGSGYMLSAELYAADGELLLSMRETAEDDGEILAGLDRLSKGLRERIGESLRSIGSSPPIVSAQTSNLEALKKFNAAGAVSLTLNPDSLKLLEEAIALDSSFVRAWLMYGLTLWNMGERARALDAVTRAYDLRDLVNERERYLITGYYEFLVTGENDEAVRAFRDLLALDPDDVSQSSVQALKALGNVSSRRGDLAQAETAWLQALEKDSLRTGAQSGYDAHRGNLARVQFNLGKYEEARATLLAPAARLDSVGEGLPPGVHFSLGLMASAAGDYEAAERHFTTLHEAWGDHPRWRARADGGLASLATLRGRFREARERKRGANALMEEHGPIGEYLASMIVLGSRRLVVTGDTAGALAEVEAELTRYPFAEVPFIERPYFLLVQFLAEAGEADRARRLLEEWERESRSDDPHDDLRGQIALAEGDYEVAASHFEQAVSGGCPVCVLPKLARAYDRAGHADTTIATYERYIKTPYHARVYWDQMFLATALERLGQLYDERGDHESAMRNYAKFVDLWREADPEAQPRVRAAQTRLEEILAEQG
jgi:tetratricopeptide (TPR) repeat protein